MGATPGRLAAVAVGARALTRETVLVAHQPLLLREEQLAVGVCGWRWVSALLAHLRCLEPTDELLHRHVVDVEKGFDGMHDLIKVRRDRLQDLPHHGGFLRRITEDRELADDVHQPMGEIVHRFPVAELERVEVT